MIEQGDIWTADLHEDVRRLVLVVSVARFHQLSERVVVAPQLFSGPDEVPFPWRVEVDDAVFAVDLLRSIPVGLLLERVGRATPSAMQQVQRVTRNIL
ncbi:MAG: type II toxin-antitoxin system PemK/MazF family toxin [Actinomycetota bacterium]